MLPLPSSSTLRFFLVLLVIVFGIIKVQRILNICVYFTTVVPCTDDDDDDGDDDDDDDNDNVRVRLG